VSSTSRRSAKRSRRGVYKHGKHGWRALISLRGRLTHLGTFPSYRLACLAYDIALGMREKKRLARKGYLFYKQLIEELGPSNEGPEPVLLQGTPSPFDQLGPVDETVEKLLEDAEQIAERQLNEPRGRGMGTATKDVSSHK
jgi:hypothetical protein